MSCGAYACVGTRCKTTCAADSDCASGRFCDAGACATKKGNGESCTGAAQCQSGACTDGRCCAQTCTTCQNCTGAGGTCVNVPGYQEDPSAPGSCTGTRACTGAGQCLKKDNQPCSNSTVECISASCPNGTCEPCGRIAGAACCPGAVCALPNLACNRGDYFNGGLCTECGKRGTLCCEQGAQCEQWAFCSGGYCSACGKLGEPCCGGGTPCLEGSCNPGTQYCSN